MDEIRKRDKERFIAGHTGSDLLEIYLILWIVVASYALFQQLLRVNFPIAASRLSLKRLMSEYIILILPIVASVTLPEYNTTLLTALVSSTILLRVFIAPRSSMYAHKESLEGPKFGFLVGFKALLQLVTICCILAVDFTVFPRRYAKVETFGTSLMDLGVGLFIFSMGITAGPRLRSSHSSMWSKLQLSVMTSIPVLSIGVVRTIATKSVNYQEHVSEYGLHWNFFYTLGAVSLIVGAALAVFPFHASPLVALGTMAGYEYALSHGLLEYILYAPRTTFVGANREGILSLLGYSVIFIFSSYLGSLLLIPKKPESAWRRDLIYLLSTSFVVHYMWRYLANIHHIRVSRRMANATYVLWVLECGCWLVALFLASDLLASGAGEHDDTSGNNMTCAHRKTVPAPTSEDASASSVILEAVNYNQLATFMLANLGMGSINLSLDTINTKPYMAIDIIIVYMIIVVLCSVIAHLKKWKLKL
ncbi:hypothetical protein SeMB42_g04922 [Synchytrium endobioticum]|uniref:GPI-anchored wall transfer protein n=1 Tax=Synchytrium endobioticum TaxID=286115 RepID=A0A507CIM9_9FUNG|nr:hypothetical protein SeLEV6574_g07335 [Synchytrium endobioticum]TPX42966.1 hypothetical protein SeMB42_g04922 [Synchytrium endobioticum]